ncbi:hypothetical protein M8J77_009111 [Diaphorina citri]|nr:hypothetical protein M8J77_009111 [Diaphorina citri]
METEVAFGLDAASWNIWAVVTLILVFCTATGNILVCLAISWEKRLQNVTNYFLMSLAITDLMVAVLVMPLGILTLVRVSSHGVVVTALALHAGDPGSIPGGVKKFVSCK